MPSIAQTPQLAITSYATPSALAYPTSIVVGPDGALWFTESKNPGLSFIEQPNNIGRITTTGVITEYPVPTAKSNPEGIAVGPDGALWFTEYDADQIGRITTAGVITEYPLPNARSEPLGITAGRDGALWFTEYGFRQIGRITTAGVITEYPLQGSSRPVAITTGPDGALWITMGVGIVRITTPGETTDYSLSSFAEAIAVGPDGDLWFGTGGSQGPAHIGRIPLAGPIIEYPAPGTVGGMTLGPDGAIWFTEHYNSAIGRMTAAGAVTEYGVPFLNLGGITLGPDGELWFTQSGNGAIAEAFFVTASLAVTPDTGFYETDHTFTGSGFASNETVLISGRSMGSPVLASVHADSSGSFTASVREPQAPYGPVLFTAVGQTSRKLGAVSVAVTPNLVLNPASGPVGSTVTAAGYGFPPFAAVQIYWSEPRTLLGSVTADVNGTFSGSADFTFTVPTAALTGANRVQGAWDCTNGGPKNQRCPNSGYGSFNVE